MIYNEIISKIYKKYNLNEGDINYLNKFFDDVIRHPEFQRRMTKEFLHHADITLGEHILEDTVVTYLQSKKKMKKKDNYRMDLALKIALFHDLYTIPWQNNKEAHVNHFFSKHGFRHPVEAVVNAIIWYPDSFKDKHDREIIIDGIIHHMYPLPVRRINEKKLAKIELKNIDNYYKLSEEYRKEIINSLNRHRLGVLSFCRSKYLEGRIMSKADKIVSSKQINDFSSAKALLTGNNKKLKNKNN